MGDLRPNNGGGSPPDDGGAHRGDLPDFPPEWGTIVIPDDASELDEDAERIRRELRDELRRDARRLQLRRVFGVPPAGTEPQTGLGIPLVIMAVAILTTLISLFVVTWDRRPGPAVPVDTLTAPGNSGPRVADAPSAALRDLTFVDSSGLRVRLGDLLPAVILLVDGCACGDLVWETAKIAPTGVMVVAVAPSAPNVAGLPATVRGVADPDAVLRSRHAGSVSGVAGAIALLVNREGLVVSTVPVRTAQDLKAQLSRLAG